MQADSASEARVYRRCSLAALAVLVGSMTGERVLNADEPRYEMRRPSLQWNVTIPFKPYTFRLLDHFITVVPRHVR